jgi:hypothetical protein
MHVTVDKIYDEIFIEKEIGSGVFADLSDINDYVGTPILYYMCRSIRVATELRGHDLYLVSLVLADT